ncbi:MAG: hypothetical protein K2H91_13770 [Lachnospiraceae bacterium]|nr:hypothetical protein [Lachnospiraceae bacterium]
MRVVPRVYFKLSVPEYILYSGISYFIKTASGRADAELENSISTGDAKLENSISPDDAQSIYERMP